jgi:hypothetical protein
MVSLSMVQTEKNEWLPSTQWPVIGTSGAAVDGKEWQTTAAGTAVYKQPSATTNLPN